MKRTALLLLIVTAIMAAIPSIALAAVKINKDGLWFNSVQFNTPGVKGWWARFHILQRHPWQEYHLGVIEGKRSSDGASTGFAWEITDAHPQLGATGNFRLFLHVRWPNTPPASPSNGYYWYSTGIGDGSVPTGAYRKLAVDYKNNGYWDLVYDNTVIAQCNWPYYTGSDTKGRTQMEVSPYDNDDATTALNVNSYVGHALDYQIKFADNLWRYMRASDYTLTPTSDSIGYTKAGSWWNNPYYTRYPNSQTKYYEWETRK